MTLPNFDFAGGPSLPSPLVDTSSTNSATGTVSAGALQLTFTATGIAIVRSDPTRYDFSDGRRIAFDTVTLSGDGAIAFGLRPSSGDCPAFVRFGANTLAAVRVNAFNTNTASTAVTNARFVALERSGANVLYRTSADGATWTTVDTQPTSAFGALSAVEIYIWAPPLAATGGVTTIDAIVSVNPPTLSVTSVSPTSGPVGTQITLTGTNLAGTSAVTVNGTACTGIINDSATQVRATIAAATTTGVLALTATAGSVTSGVTFTVTPTLVANAFRIVAGSLPASPVAGTPYTFQVEAIDTTQGNARVTSYNAASIVVGLDAALPDGLVVISGDADEPMVSGLASFTLTFAYAASPPTITTIAPTSGPIGTVVTVTGTNLAGTSAVSVNGTAGTTILNDSATQIRFTIGAGTTTGALSLTTPGGTVAGPVFTVTVITVAPVITSISPTSGPVGTVVTITGTNLAPPTVVTLGLRAAAFSGNATTITATVPAGATSGAWFVETAAGVASSALFTVTRAAPPASALTLRWVLDAFPAEQSMTAARVLLQDSRNAIVVRDVVDVETDRYVVPTGVTWALLDGADVLLSGALTVNGDGWRGEVVLDPGTVFGAPPVLVITASIGGATWTRDYPILLTERV